MNEKNPTSKLRDDLLSLTYRCPKGSYAPRCPFAMLCGLSHHSRQSVFARMEYDELVQLFDFVPQCACPADPRIAAPEHSAGRASVVPAK